MFPIKEERDLNSNQNNNRGKGGGNKRNMTAIVSILLWALVLTLLVNLATSRLQQANSVEVSYGQFRQLIMQDAVESVVMSSGKYTFRAGPPAECWTCPCWTGQPPSNSRFRARIRPRAPAAGSPWSTSAPP